MKRLAIIIIAITATLAYASANAQNIIGIRHKISGSAVDAEGRPATGAVIAAMRDGRQEAGTVADGEGRFVLALAEGEYALTVEFIGCETVVRELHVSGDAELDPFVLEESGIGIESVEVKAQVIRREADRFVVDVANMPSAAGKDGVELLQSSPGVFITDDTVTVNGRSGTKVYVNEREVRYTGERLLTYLRGLKNDEIQTIEVVPSAGAEYDADTAGGVIKITLRRKRDDGLMGGLTTAANLNDMLLYCSPSAWLDHRTGRWTFSASGNYGYRRYDSSAEERTASPDGTPLLSSSMASRTTGNSGGAKLGVVCEINDRHSAGFEIGYDRDGERGVAESSSMLQTLFIESALTDNRSRSASDDITALFNYIVRLDTLGSTVKLLADYTHQQSIGRNGYTTVKSTLLGDELHLRDSLCRDRSGTDYNITTVSVDCNKVFTPKFTLRGGAKYTNNLMASNIRYDLLDGEEWQTRPSYNYDVRCTENIGAAYIAGDARLGRWGMTLGLRGEYTATKGRGSAVRQNYFSLFPNANVSFGLTRDCSYMLVAQYSRSIVRPNFWALNPARIQVSEYLYQTGNPDLDPSFIDNVVLTAVLKYKYTLSVGLQLARDQIQQRMAVDNDNTMIYSLITDNIDRTELWYATTNLPLEFTSFWSANINLTAMYTGTRIARGQAMTYHPMAMANATMNFTLPLDFFIELNYWGMTRSYLSNIYVSGRHGLGITLKKKFLKDKFTLSAGAQNIILQNQTITYTEAQSTRRITHGSGWFRPSFRFSASWNFNVGKHFNKRQIESGADSSRLSR